MRTIRKATGAGVLTRQTKRLFERCNQSVLTSLVGSIAAGRVVVVAARDDRDEVEDANEVQVRE